jgi:hypothetical protein
MGKTCNHRLKNQTEKSSTMTDQRTFNFEETGDETMKKDCGVARVANVYQKNLADKNIGYGVPTFIKMELEGHEIPALHGAEQTIRQYKPKLAVCLYHKPADMWEIPLLLKNYVPEYRFFCKKSHPVCEFVLFAIV